MYFSRLTPRRLLTLYIAVIAFTFLYAPIKAQTPGGVPSTNLKLWLNAGTGLGLTGTSVNTWADKSGNANNGTSTGSSKPTLSAGGLNYKNVVNFGGNGGVQGNITGSITSSTASVFMVANIKSTSASGAGAFSLVTTGAGKYDNNSNSYASFFERSTGTATNIATERNSTNTDVVTSGTDKVAVLTNVYRPLLSTLGLTYNNTNTIYYNGLLTKNSAYTAAAFNAASYEVGSRYTNGATASYLTGSIAEVILFNTEITAAQQNQVQSYLAIKYGLTLDQSTATNYVSANGTTVWNAATNSGYTSNIFGIAYDSTSGGGALYVKKAMSYNTGALTVQNPSALTAGGFMMFSDNGLTGTGTVSGYPNSVTTTTNTVWRVSQTSIGGGTVGTVSIVFPSPNFSNPVLLINTGTGWASATAVTAASASGATYTFNNVTLADGYLFTFGVAPYTSPGGVFTNLKIWLNPSNIVAAGTTINSWSDASGYAFNAATANGTKQTLTTAGLNNNNIATFAGTGSYTGTLTTPITSNAVTAFMVGNIKSTSTSGGGALSLCTALAGNSDTSSTTFASLFERSTVTATTVASHRKGVQLQAAASATDATHLFQNVFQASSNNQYFYKEGKQVGNATYTTTPFNAGLYTVGSRYINNVGTNGYLTGTIAEEIVYDRELTTTEQNQVNSYLAIKYGLTLDQTTATNYTSSNGTVVWNANTNAGYTNNVFGIAQDNGSGLTQNKSTSINTYALTIQSPSALTNGGFLMVSDNGLTGVGNVSGYAGSVSTSLNTIWRASVTSIGGGTVGTVSIVYTSTYYSNPVLLINTGSGWGSATVVAASSVSGYTYTFTGVTLADGNLFTIGVAAYASPGGVFTNLKLWLNPSNISATGTTVNTWSDASGYNNNATTANGTKQTLTTSAVNNNNVVTFANTGSYTGTFGAPITSSAVTAFMVGNIKSTSVAGGGALSICTALAGNSDTSSTTFASLFERSTLTATTVATHRKGAQVQAALTSTDATHIFQNVFQASSNNEYFYKEGKQVGTHAYTTAPFNAGLYTVGSRYVNNAGTNLYLTGTVAEQIIYDRELTTAEQNQVSSYLAIKYGITLDQTMATNYTSSNGTIVWNATTNAGYTNNIFGIAQDNGSGLTQNKSTSINTSLLTIQNPTALTNGGFLMLSDNGITGIVASVSMPAGIVINSNTIWRVSITSIGGGTVGNVDLVYVSPIANPKLIIDNGSGFASATPISATSSVGNIYTFSGVTLANANRIVFGSGPPATSPGGVFVNLKLWLNANTGVTATGTTVTAWNDQSGLSYNATTVTGTAGNNPVLTTNGLNSYPVITFNGSGALQGAFTNNITSGAVTAYMVGTINSTSAAGAGAFSLCAAGAGNSDNVTASYVSLFERSTTTATTVATERNATNIQASTLSASSPHLFGNVFQASSSNEYFYKEGKQVNNTAFTTAALNSGLYTIGSRYTANAPANFLNGSIAEVVMFDRELTSTEQNEVQSYLALKYGLTLDQTTATNYVNSANNIIWNAATNSSYNHNVFGIGQDNSSGLVQTKSTSTTGAVLTIQNPSALSNGGFLILSDNGLVNSSPASGMPGSIAAVTNTIWRVSQTSISGGTVGTVDIVYTSAFANPQLIIDNGSGFALAAPMAPTSSASNVYTFAGVTLADGYRITFGSRYIAPAGVLSNLKLWFNAGKGVATTGSAVTSWSDQGGWSNNTTVINGAGNPTLTANSVNNNPAITFAGVNGLQGSFATPITSTGVTAFYVGNISSTSASGAGAFSISSTGVNDNTGTLSSSFFERYSGSTGTVAFERNASNVGASTTTTNSTHLLTNINRTATNFINFFKDGKSVNNTAFTATAFNSNLFTLGSRYLSTGATNYMIGNIAEVIFYDRELTTAEQNAVQSYLAVKYGLSLDQTAATSYVSSSNLTIWSAAANAGYTANIFGIENDSLGGLYQPQGVSVNSNILAVSSPSSLPNGGALMISDNNQASNAYNSISGVPGVGLTLAKKWRVSRTGNVGTVTLTFNYNTSHMPNIRLLIDTTGTGTYKVVTPSSIAGSVITFNTVKLLDGYIITLAGNNTGSSAAGFSTESSSLGLWLKSTTGVNYTANAFTGFNQVTAWVDRLTGYNDTAVQAANNNQPYYVASDASFNGNPVIKFDNVNQFATISGASFTSTPYTAIIVYNDNTFGAGTRYALNGSNTWNMGIQTAKAYLNSGGTVILDTNYVQDSRAFIQTVIAGTGSSNQALYKNGALINTLTGNVAPGTLSLSSATNPLGGSIAEVIVYNTQISALTKQMLESYLAIKYGISLDQHIPTNYLNSSYGIVWNTTANSTFSNNIFGIAMDNGSGLNVTNSASINSGAILRISNPSALTNGSYLLVGDNGGHVNQFGVSPGLPSGLTHIMNRQWKVALTGTAGTVTLKLDNSAMAVYPSITTPTLLVDTTGTGKYKAYTGVANGISVTYTNVRLVNNALIQFGIPDGSTAISIQAYHNGTPISKVWQGDTIHYVLAVSGGLPGSPIYVNDTLSNNQQYIPSSLNANGWTLGGGGAGAWFNGSNVATATWNNLSPVPGASSLIPVYGANAVIGEAVLNNPSGSQVTLNNGLDGFWPVYFKTSSGNEKSLEINHHSNVTNAIYQCWNITTAASCASDMSALGTLTGFMTNQNGGHVQVGNKVYFPLSNKNNLSATTGYQPAMGCIDLNPTGNPVYCGGAFPLTLSSDSISINGNQWYSYSSFTNIGSKVYSVFLNMHGQYKITYVDVSSGTPVYATPVTFKTYPGLTTLGANPYVVALTNNKLAVVTNHSNDTAAAFCLDVSNWPSIKDCSGSSTLTNLPFANTGVVNVSPTLDTTGKVNGFCLGDNVNLACTNVVCYDTASHAVTAPAGFQPSAFECNSLTYNGKVITARNQQSVTGYSQIYCYDFKKKVSCGTVVYPKVNLIYGLGWRTDYLGTCFLTYGDTKILTQWRVNTDSTLTPNATTCTTPSPTVFTVNDPVVTYCDGKAQNIQWANVTLTNLPTNVGNHRLQLLDTNNNVLESYVIPQTVTSFSQAISSSYSAHNKFLLKFLPGSNFTGNNYPVNVVVNYSNNSSNPEICFDATVNNCTTSPVQDFGGVSGGGTGFVGAQSQQAYALGGTSITGTLWNDANGNAVFDGTDANTILGKTLYATICYPGDTVLFTKPILPNGSFFFDKLQFNMFNTKLHITTYIPAAGSILTKDTLPAGWVFTGLNGGTGNLYFSGPQPGKHPPLRIDIAYCEAQNQGIGFDRVPKADSVLYTLTSPVPNSLIPLSGTGGINSPGPLSGSDAEDGIMGAGNTLVITTLPTHGTLWYGGMPIAHPFDTIYNYQPNLLQWQVTGGGYTSTSFNFAWIDAAGAMGTSSSYTMVFWSILPVKLVDFNGEVNECLPTLHWSTATEENVAYFDVQQSMDGANFESIGHIEAHNISHTLTNYSFKATSPISGQVYYRIKEVDNDSSFHYPGHIIALHSDCGKDGKYSYVLQPNPATDFVEVNMVGAAQYEVSLLTISGQVVYDYVTQGIWHIDLSHLSAGPYIIRYMDVNTHQVHSENLVVSK